MKSFRRMHRSVSFVCTILILYHRYWSCEACSVEPSASPGLRFSCAHTDDVQATSAFSLWAGSSLHGMLGFKARLAAYDSVCQHAYYEDNLVVGYGACAAALITTRGHEQRFFTNLRFYEKGYVTLMHDGRHKIAVCLVLDEETMMNWGDLWSVLFQHLQAQSLSVALLSTTHKSLLNEHCNLQISYKNVNKFVVVPFQSDYWSLGNLQPYNFRTLTPIDALMLGTGKTTTRRRLIANTIHEHGHLHQMAYTDTGYTLTTQLYNDVYRARVVVLVREHDDDPLDAPFLSLALSILTSGKCVLIESPQSSDHQRAPVSMSEIYSAYDKIASRVDELLGFSDQERENRARALASHIISTAQPLIFSNLA